MTTDELNDILESHEFESSFKYRAEQHKFTFKENFIGKDGIKLCRYKLSKVQDSFWLNVFEDTESIFTDNFKNIIIDVKDDSRFPLILNFEGGGLDITLECIS